jgi:histidyl-tRNA synthetase
MRAGQVKRGLPPLSSTYTRPLSLSLARSLTFPTLSLAPVQVNLAATLREGGFAVDVLLEPAKKLQKAFSYADRVNGRRVLLVAPDEWAKGEVRMKDLRTTVEEEKQVDLKVEGLLAQLEARGITPLERPKV